MLQLAAEVPVKQKDGTKLEKLEIRVIIRQLLRLVNLIGYL
jgi:hypothetical protein